MLDEVAKQVQPIMRRRSFTVPLLSEFFPGNARLLVRCGVVRSCRRDPNV